MYWLELTGFILAIIALLLVSSAGVFMVALQLPGTWTIAAATALFAWVYWEPGDPMIGWWTLSAMLVLCVLGELIETLAGAVGAKGAGGSKRSIALAIVMGIAGAIMGTFFIPIPVVGTLIGAALGSGTGAVLGELWIGRDWKLALKTGQGAAIGRFAGSVGKLIVAAGMWLWVVIALIWP